MATDRRSVRLFAVLALGCTLVACVAVVTAARSGTAPVGSASAATRVLSSAQAAKRPVVVFRSLDRREGAALGQVAITGAEGASDTRDLAPLRCERVHVGPRNGICVARASGFAKGYEARILGPDLGVRDAVGVAGTPSRARVSPDGRHGAVTMFVTGHSYAAAGSFSTQTTLIDLRDGSAIGQLEQFTTFRGSRQVTAADANFWGITFARDGDRFYATLATGGRTYLVEGSIGDRTMRTLRENVECPSLSPDGSRIAFKKRVPGGQGLWRLAVVELATRRETLLADRRSVDDQVEWLDDDNVLYGIDDGIWIARADGGGRPAAFRRDAGSPAVVRW